MEFFANNVGFNCTDRIKGQHRLRIGLIDADLLDHGTRHPNLVLLKISGYCKSYGHIVRLICDYSEIVDLQKSLFPRAPKEDYDILVMSKVFNFSKIPKPVQNLIDEGFIIYGGTGFFDMQDESNLVKSPNLPHEVEHFMPDYSLYDEYIDKVTNGDAQLIKRNWDDYKNYSIGFTTRGCVRQCSFCVNKLERHVYEWSPVSEFLDSSRKAIYLWDDNIMAAPPKVFKKVLDDLIATDKPFQFRQGMDIRLMTETKAVLLSNVKYHGDFIFAFDHYRLDIPKEKKEVEQIVKGLKVWRQFVNKSTKLYVLVAFDGIDAKDIEGTFYRIKILMEFGCLPYIMRYQDWKISKYRDMYVQIARWCNQPSFYKKMSFRQFCVRNEEYHQGIQDIHPKGEYATEVVYPKGFVPKVKYCSSYQAMVDFEKENPEIAQQYFDLRFEELNKYKIK